MKQLYKHPSFLTHVLNGLILLIAFVMVVKYRKEIKTLDPYKIIILLLLISSAVGIHGISHLGLEKNYDYHPLK